jgi:hypothetical protein
VSPPLALVQALLKQSAANTIASYSMDNDYKETVSTTKTLNKEAEYYVSDYMWEVPG